MNYYNVSIIRILTSTAVAHVLLKSPDVLLLAAWYQTVFIKILLFLAPDQEGVLFLEGMSEQYHLSCLEQSPLQHTHWLLCPDRRQPITGPQSFARERVTLAAPLMV